MNPQHPPLFCFKRRRLKGKQQATGERITPVRYSVVVAAEEHGSETGGRSTVAGDRRYCSDRCTRCQSRTLVQCLRRFSPPPPIPHAPRSPCSGSIYWDLCYTMCCQHGPGYPHNSAQECQFDLSPVAAAPTPHFFSHKPHRFLILPVFLCCCFGNSSMVAQRRPI
jgi:hypothetical protein